MTTVHWITLVANVAVWPGLVWDFARRLARWRASPELADRIGLWAYGISCPAWTWMALDTGVTAQGWALLWAPLQAWNAVHFGQRWLEIWRRRRRKRPQRATGRVVDLGHRLAVEAS